MLVKRFAHASLVMVAALLVLSCAPQTTPMPKSTQAPTPTLRSTLPSLFRIYDNSAYGISIKYPQDWLISEETLKDSQNTSNYGNAHIPVQFQSSPRECTFSIRIMDLSKIAQTFDEWSQGLFKAANDGRSPGFETHLISSGRTLLAGRPAFQVLYTQNQGKLKMQSLGVWALIGNKIYDINGTVFEPAKFADFLPTIQQMIDSFEIKPPTATTSPLASTQQPAAQTPNIQLRAGVEYWPSMALLAVIAPNYKAWYGFKLIIQNASHSYVGIFDGSELADHLDLGPAGPRFNLGGFDFSDSAGNVLDLGPYSQFNLDPAGTWSISLRAKLIPTGSYEQVTLFSYPGKLVVAP